MNEGFVKRLTEAFNHESMADVARRLKIPHATVRNYFMGRLPAPEVLMKIAKETGVSLNWLLIGTGDKYAGQTGPIELGRFIEEKITQLIEQRMSDAGIAAPKREISDFDVQAAVRRLNDPQDVLKEWFISEGRAIPNDFGVVFFNGWETFSDEQKAAAVVDAKKVLDKSLS